MLIPTNLKTSPVQQIILVLCIVLFARVGVDAVPSFKRPGWLASINRRPISDRSAGSPTNYVVSSKIIFQRGGDHDVNINDTRDDNNGKMEQLVIIIDVDNTLYSEGDLLSSTGAGIESQIIQNTHLFGLLHFNQTSQQCDALYKEYGSTIEGWRHTLPQEQVEDTMARFYREVYDPIDYSCLLGTNKKEMTENDEEQTRSGYDHGRALQQRRALSGFLKDISQSHPVYLASNSPKAHVFRVINSMGLAHVNFAGVLSPDMDRSVPLQAKPNPPQLIYPTKASPEQYFQHILELYPPSSNRVVLLDDSRHNIRAAEAVGIEGILINQSGRTFEEGLAQVLGHILPLKPAGAQSEGSGFTFSDLRYLRAKNKIDMQAINPTVWNQLAQQLALRMQQSGDGTLTIAELGAGMLSMLELIIAGGGKDAAEKRSMLDLLNALLDPPQRIKKLEYFAYESNANLLDGCKETLRRMGFQECQESSSEDGASFTCTLPEPANDIEITLHFRQTDFQCEKSPRQKLDLIIGCCFADLFDPDQLTLALHRFVIGDSRPLVYFPITFAGTTQLKPSLPRMSSLCPRNKIIASDTTAFSLYSESLTTHGHNLDPSLIVNAMTEYGGALISKESSDWVIDPSFDRYLWETMMYFFGMSGAREMTRQHWDAAGWIKRCRQYPRTIVVSNVDLLFHLHAPSPEVRETNKDVASTGNDSTYGSSIVPVQEIQFVAPYNVTMVTKHWDTTSSSHLSPDQVEIKALYSLISSGTELKIFRGSFESASLDVNIKGMEDEAMEYPLAYGYSLVGRVVACGSNVDDALIGRLVFTFSPHSTRVIVHKDAIQLVPDGIGAEDAIFMPSVETALSLVHDAHIRLGENVAVYGQGESSIL